MSPLPAGNVCDRALGGFEVIEHELRTPLTTLRSMAEILRDYPDLSEAQRQRFLDSMIAENERLSRTVDRLLRWLSEATAFAGMILMFQKEVADRLTARPGTAAYGRLSVAAQWRCAVGRLFDIDRRAFTPPPKVTSTVVELRSYPQPLHEADPSALERVTAAAFNQRRKMLRASLAALGVDPQALLAAAAIDPRLRPEALDIGQFCALARAFSALRAGA